MIITKCVLPIAGYGTRFLPITKSVPKEMLPIINKPLVQYAVEEALSSDINDITMIVSKYHCIAQDYFNKNKQLCLDISNIGKDQGLKELNNIIDKTNFSYIEQKKTKGLGDAILVGAKNLINEQAFAVILTDDLCVNTEGDSVLKQMIDLYYKYKCAIVAVEEIDINNSNKYGIIAGKEIATGIYRINNMIEKPNSAMAPSNLAIIGRYILTNDIFDIISKTAVGVGGEVQITDALLNLAQQGKVIAYKFKGQRFDCGQASGLIAATNFFAKNY